MQARMDIALIQAILKYAMLRLMINGRTSLGTFVINKDAQRSPGPSKSSVLF